jgi:hypothetical protein
VLRDCEAGAPRSVYDGGRIDGGTFMPGRWALVPRGRYMWASVQTVRGCPKHCSFCSVWRTDGQRPRQRRIDAVIDEIVDLRRRGFRFIVLADDNFYPVTREDLRMAARRQDPGRLEQLSALRAERPSDRPETFDACASVAERSDVSFAQFVMLQPLPGTLDFAAWEKSLGENVPRVDGVPLTRYWLIPAAKRPKVYIEHPAMDADEIRRRTQGVWDRFYSLPGGNLIPTRVLTCGRATSAARAADGRRQSRRRCRAASSASPR